MYLQAVPHPGVSHPTFTPHCPPARWSGKLLGLCESSQGDKLSHTGTSPAPQHYLPRGNSNFFGVYCFCGLMVRLRDPLEELRFCLARGSAFRADPDTSHSFASFSYSPFIVLSPFRCCYYSHLTSRRSSFKSRVATTFTKCNVLFMALIQAFWRK